MALKIVPLPYQTLTEQRLRLIIEYLRIEPEGVLRKELTEVVGLPLGSSTMTYRLLKQAGLIIIQNLPHGSRHRQFITPTEKLLEQSTEESLDQALGRTPPQPPALSTKSPTPPKLLSLPEKLSPTLSTPLQKIVVTRHQAIVEYMKEIGLIDDTTPVYPHARDTMVEGKHVFGVLPLHLAARAARLTTIPLLGIPRNQLRGRDLTLDEVRRYAGPPTTYEVRQVGVEF